MSLSVQRKVAMNANIHVAVEEPQHDLQCKHVPRHTFSVCCKIRLITSDSGKGEDHIHVCSRANILMYVVYGKCTLLMERGYCRSDPVQVQSTI